MDPPLHKESLKAVKRVGQAVVSAKADEVGNDRAETKELIPDFLKSRKACAPEVPSLVATAPEALERAISEVLSADVGSGSSLAHDEKPTTRLNRISVNVLLRLLGYFWPISVSPLRFPLDYHE